MRGWNVFARFAARAAVLCMICQGGGRAWAGPEVPGEPANGVAPNGMPLHGMPVADPCRAGECAPRAATYGHYQPQWREWPPERRPDRFFPQSISAEPIPAPAGTEPPQLPREKVTPSKPSLPPLPTLPTEIPPTLPGLNGKPPLENPIRMDDRPPLIPQEPQRPLPLEPLPPLPGQRLPGEMPGPAPSPLLPGESPARPSLPLEPSPKPSDFPPLPMEPVQKPPAAPALPLEPASPFREELPGGDVLPGLPGPKPPTKSGPASKPAAAPSRPPEAPLPAPNPKPAGADGTRTLRPQAPGAAENVPLPVEPWAEPKPWRPTPADQAAPQASDRPRMRAAPWGPPADPAVYLPDRQPVLPAASLAPAAAPAPNWPVALDGYCPVTLAETEQWTAGDPRLGVEHQGRTYLMAGEAQRQRFLANPNRYAPVLGGADPVLAADAKSDVPGRTEHCVVYDGRLYMFSSAAMLARFHQNPKKYSAAAARGAY